MLRILLLEDSSQDVEILRELLVDAGFELEMDRTAVEKEFVSFLRSRTYDIILSDFKLPGFDAFTALRWAKEICPKVPFICISGTIGEETAVELLKQGAVDYLLKDKLAKLPSAIKRAIDEAKQKELQQQAEVACLNSEAKYHALIDQARDSILLIELSDEEIPVIRDANAAAARMHGYSREDLIGKPISFLVSEYQESIFTERLNVLMGSEAKEALFNAQHRRKDGSIFELEVSVKMINVGNRSLLLDISRDITERRLAEEKIKLFSDAVSSSFDCFILTDLRGNINFVNASAVKAFGYTYEEFLNLNISSLDANPEAGKIIMQGIAANGKWSGEITSIKKNKEIFYSILSAFIVKDEKGDSKGTMGILRDITERKLAEELKVKLQAQQQTFIDKLVESEKKYRILFEISADGIAIADINARKILYANPSLCKMLGYTEDELISMNVWDIHPKDKLRDIMSKFNSQAMWEIVFEEDIPCLKKNGEIVYVDFSMSVAIIDEIKCSVGIFREITKRKEKEDALKTSEKLLNSIVENIPNMIFLKNAKDLSFVKFNKAGEDLLGVSRETLIGNDGLYLFTKEQADNFRDKDRQVLNSKRILDIPEENILTKNKGTRVLHTQKIPLLDKNGESKYLLGISEDITEYKHLQEQLLQSQKMDAIGTLTGGIAHDFNNMLTVISGNAYIAMKEMDKKSQIYDNLNEITIAGERAATLTRQLLLYSRKQPMGFFPSNINNIINNLLKMLRSLIGEDIEIKLELDPGIQIIKADVSNLEQVIMNLCINARDAMPGGGIITIKTENAILSEGQIGAGEEALPGSYVVISVEDSGTGMDKETIKHIFEPFFSTKGVGKGTGLGLSVVYGILKAHNGWINVYSEPGHGTTFKCYLPGGKIEAIVNSEEKVEDLRVTGKGEHILVIEDEAMVLAYIERILSTNGYRVHKAVNGKTATDVFKENSDSIELVVSDMILPGENGLDIVDKLKQVKNSVKVIICSGYLDDKTQFAKIKEKGYEFVQKPFETIKLLRTIRQILDV